MISLYNSRTRKKENFTPNSPPNVTMYSCGPTVYDEQHIGNLRTAIFSDTLKRLLTANNFKVNHVINITDVGHLVGDGDSGEDKMEKGSKREGKSAWDIAKHFTQIYFDHIKALNVIEPKIWAKATDHIPEQIAQVQKLIDNGYTYETSDGIYFDTTKDPNYGDLAELKKQKRQAGTRIDMGEKKHPHDFALWKFSKDNEKRQMEWNAFGKMGFPGWHIECSAMAIKHLGEHIDIHTGGMDLKATHHPNEIAQAQAAGSHKPWVNFWLHGEFLLIDNGKMGKSLGNAFTLSTLIEKGYDPISYRYFLLQAHYRKQLNFTWEALTAAEQGLKNLRKKISLLPKIGIENPGFKKAFLLFLNDDLNTSEAIALLWESVKKQEIDQNIIIWCDKILGLDLIIHKEPLPAIIESLLNKRLEARKNKNWNESDRLRDEIKKHGYDIEDTSSGQKITKE